MTRMRLLLAASVPVGERARQLGDEPFRTCTMRWRHEDALRRGRYSPGGLVPGLMETIKPEGTSMVAPRKYPEELRERSLQPHSCPLRPAGGVVGGGRHGGQQGSTGGVRGGVEQLGAGGAAADAGRPGAPPAAPARAGGQRVRPR